MKDRIKKAICFTENHNDGQYLAGARLVYDTEIDPDSVSADSFTVEGQHVTDVKARGCDVIISIDTSSDTTEVFSHPKFNGKPPEHGPGGPKGGKGPFGPMGPGGAGGPEGKHLRPIQLKVLQKRDIRTADQEVLSAASDPIVTDEKSEPVVEDFVPGSFEGMNYGLFTPKQTKEGVKYPLVVFVPDGEAGGYDPKIALAQGNGAVSWASPAWQEKHPCYVLSPVTSGLRLTNDQDETEGSGLHILKELIDEITARNQVDENRIYCTGQSGGGMCFAEMNIQYPDYFAAAMFVACQWNAERIGKTCAHKKFWILVSNNDMKAFPGWNAMTDELEKNGAKIARHRWNAKSSAEELNRLAEEAAREDADIHYTVFEDSSVVPEGIPATPMTNHVNTWPVAYSIDAVKEWIFSQSLADPVNC